MIDYLHRHAKNVRQIVADAAVDGGATATAFTGDSWQAYAARWALCHLLVHNPNYSARFLRSGSGFLNGATARFEDAFGSVLDEIDFEYRQFVLHLDQGYRVDLCRWDWDRKFRPATSTPINARVAAQRGWQASGAIVTKGETYQYRSKGAWRMDGGKQDVSADGQADGAGRLEAVVFQDFKLGEPFPLGVQGTFTAPSDGKLFLRCHDRWNELADNSGFVTVKIGKSARKAAATAEKSASGDFVIRNPPITLADSPHHSRLGWRRYTIGWLAAGCKSSTLADPALLSLIHEACLQFQRVHAFLDRGDDREDRQLRIPGIEILADVPHAWPAGLLPERKESIRRRWKNTAWRSRTSTPS